MRRRAPGGLFDLRREIERFSTKAVAELSRTAASAFKVDVLSDPEFLSIYRRCYPYTMTSIEVVHALYEAVKHLSAFARTGAFVECGVWRGGSAMAMALTLLRAGETDREIFLYDTFEGMPPGSPEDGLAIQAMRNVDLAVPLEEVRANLRKTGYDARRLAFVAGRVEDSIPEVVPESIALLRLDTDFYSSTRHELTHLFPRLVRGGILIIDDYALPGCRRAVDEYFADNGVEIYLQRVDVSARLGVRT